jgi:hypothetical protein
MLVEPDQYGGRTFNLIGEYQAGNQIVSPLWTCLYGGQADELLVIARISPDT